MSSDTTSGWIPNCVPSVADAELEYLTETVRAGWIGSAGPVYERFSQAFCDYVGVDRCVPVASGTAALHLALAALGVERGDVVFVPSLTFAATATPAAMLGARVVPVDVKPPTWTLDAEDLERAVAEERAADRLPRCVLPVHLYSMPADMGPILAVARECGLYVVEDATEGLGTSIAGRHLGLAGEFGCFSFNVNKLVTAGGGGMVVATSDKLLDRVAHLSQQARVDRVQFQHDEVGYNYRFSALHAAVGLAQLERVETVIARKRQVFQTYQAALGDRLEFVQAPEGCDCGYWLSNALLPRGLETPAAEVVRLAQARSVELRPWFMPLHLQPAWPDRSCPRSEEAWRRGLTLPCSPGISDEELETVVSVLGDILDGVD